MKFAKISRICVAALLMLLFVFTIEGYANKQAEINRTKARHYYLKGAVNEAEGHIDRAYEYYKKAYELDPTYSEAAFAYGSNRINLLADTFTSRYELLRNLSYMKTLVEYSPKDVNTSEIYSYYAGVADTIPESIRVYERLVNHYPGMSRLYLPLAFFYVNEGEIEKAVKSISEYERLEGASEETTIRKITYRLSAGDTIGALAEIDSYVAGNPGKLEPLADKALIYGMLGYKDTALVLLEEAIREFPDNGEIKYNAGLMYLEKGDTTKFHSLVSDAIDSEGMEYEDHMELLVAYLKSLRFNGTHYEESDAIFAKVYALYPRDGRFLDIYADYELMKGDFEATYVKEKEAYDLEPDNPVLLRRLISFSVLTGKPEEGLKAFEEFPEKEVRKEYGTLMVYISAAQLADEYEKALAWTDTLVSVTIPELSLEDSITNDIMDALKTIYDPRDLFLASTVYEVAGDLFAKTGNEKGAIRSYENAIILSPEGNPSALNNYAYYLVENAKSEPGTPKFEKAKELSYKSLEETQEDPQSTYYDTYAWILFKEGNYKEALKYQELAIELAGEEEQVELLSHYGDILLKNGQEEKAIEQWKKALELDPENETLKRKIEESTIYE